MRVEDFIEATNTATTPEEVFGLFQKATSSLGLDRINYCALKDHPIYDSINSPAVMLNYPNDWTSYYVENGYIQLDPIRKKAIQSRGPFTWESVVKSGKLGRPETRLMLEADESGLHEGIGIPLHGPHGEVMGIGIASSVRGVESERLLGKVFSLSIQFHVAYSALSLPETLGAQMVHLTPREREVLQWCAQGKSNWAIGEILNISEHGVEFHVRNILNKLQADSRITAVVKALRFNLITH